MTTSKGLPIETAPRGPRVLVWVDPSAGRPGYFTISAYHKATGWVMHGRRPPTLWWPLPATPVQTGAQ